MSRLTSMALRNGDLNLTLWALSLNAWEQTQRDYAVSTMRDASEILARVTMLPDSLQLRAVSVIYNKEPGQLAVTSRENMKARGEYHSTGTSGFTEAGVPAGYDVAAGSVTGYRQWEFQITSKLMKGAYGNTWPRAIHPSHRYEASCESHGGRNVPYEDDCGCGFWAYWLPSKTAGQYNCNITGAIEGSGKVILGENGFRSQYAVIRGLAVTGTARFTGTENILEMTDISRWLEARYQTPVFPTVTEMIDAIGTDLVYSPAARRAREFAVVETDDILSYLVVLNLVIGITQQCAGGITGSLHDMMVINSERLCLLAVLARR